MFNWSTLDQDYSNCQMIPVHLKAVSALPSEAKKRQNSLSRAFAVDGKTLPHSNVIVAEQVAQKLKIWPK